MHDSFRITFLTLFFVMNTAAAHAASIVRSIAVEGNVVFTSREILESIATRQSGVYSPSLAQADRMLLTDNYRRRGYLAPVIEFVPHQDLRDTSIVDLVITISEGKPTVVGFILPEGQQHFSFTDILSQFDLKVGDPLVEEVLENDIDQLLLRYERDGFPFAACQIGNLHARPGNDVDTVDVGLTVEEGNRVTIDEIRIEGNKETDPAVVVRETRIHSGETFNPVKVNAIKPRLLRLNIFSNVSDPELYVRNQKNGLLIKVQEGSTNTFDGVGLRDGPGNDFHEKSLRDQAEVEFSVGERRSCVARAERPVS